MQIDMSRFRATFFVEAAEHLAHMEAALLQLENAPQDSELLNTIFRAAHSIKGASTTFGVDEVGRFTHVLENLLDRMRDGLISVNGEVVEVLLTSVDVIEGLIAAAKDGALPPDNVEATLLELNRVNGNPTSVDNKTTAPPAKTDNDTTRTLRIGFQPSRDFFRFGQEPSLLLRELHELGEVKSIKVDASQLPLLTEMDPESCYLSWELELHTTLADEKVAEVFMFLDDASRFTINEVGLPTALSASTSASTSANACVSNSSGVDDSAVAVESKSLSVADKPAASVATSRPATIPENETVRVDRARLDEMINQIGELVIGTSMVEQVLKSLTGGNESPAMDQLAKIVRDLQEMSLSLRMVPIAATFQKMARVVRDLSRKLDKKIEFSTEGEDTELDKSVVDQIGDPLVHMVRNAADHGVETSAERLAAGKPEQGRVHLRAYQQGGNIFIEIEDDGRGLNRQRIVQKAIERGIISADDNLSDNEICNLIFQPGFSTAETVTDVSGRGVGMDVVRRNVESLQGSVSIRSEIGKGSLITVRLPLTLAILDGLLIRLEEEVYVLPLLSVVESICIQPKEIQRVVGAGEVVLLRGEVVPVIRLNQVLSLKSSQMDELSGLLVIVEDQGRRFALVVDELLGQQQVVIKNLETNFQKVPGVAGATILGNGRVALILDLFAISNLCSNETPRRTGTTVGLPYEPCSGAC